MVIRPVKALRSRDQIPRLFSLVVLLIGLWGLGGAAIVSAQLPSFTTPTTSPQLPPANVERRGTLESVAIRLDGQELFRIASPTVLNRNDPGTQIPVEVRAKQVEANLNQVITDVKEAGAGDLNPNALQVLIETMQGQPVLYAKDTLLPEAMVLLTVTSADAQYHSVSQRVLADRWQTILEEDLRQALELRKPEALRRQIRSVISTLVATTIATLGLGAIWFTLGRRKQRLEQRQVNQSKVTTPQTQPPSPPGSAQIEPDLEMFQGSTPTATGAIFAVVVVLGDRVCLDEWHRLQPQRLPPNSPTSPPSDHGADRATSHLVFNGTGESAHGFSDRSFHSNPRTRAITHRSQLTAHYDDRQCD